MSEKEEAKPWQPDVNWLQRRLDRLEDEMREQCRTHARRIRLLVRILVDKKIIGEETAKSVEETFGKKGNIKLDWLYEELEKRKKD